jgi:hypothetical protein
MSFSEVIKGRVLTVVRCASGHQLWVRDARTGRERYVIVETFPQPPLFPGHAVTVVLSGVSVCAIANHETQEQHFYRPIWPAGPYQSYAAGCGSLFLLVLFLFSLWVGQVFYRLGFEAGLTGTVALALVSAVGLVCRIESNNRAKAHNEDLDYELTQLISNPIQEQIQV